MKSFFIKGVQVPREVILKGMNPCRRAAQETRQKAMPSLQGQKAISASPRQKTIPSSRGQKVISSLQGRDSFSLPHEIEGKNHHHIGRSLRGRSINVQRFTTLKTPLHLKPLVLMLWVRPRNKYLNPYFRKKLKERIYHANSLGRPSSYMMVRLALWNMSTITIKA